MRQAGVQIVFETTRHAAVGLVEAFHKMHVYTRLYRILTSTLRRVRPDAVVLIDFPDFNLRFAERVVDAGIPNVYYIGPQIWAWRPGRIKTIRRLIRKMLVIFDFEEVIYRKAGVDVAFVGHPLMDGLGDSHRNDSLRRELKVLKEQFLIGLLPGSRDKQFRTLLPILLKSAEVIRTEVGNARFVVACAPSINPKRVLKHFSEIPVVWNRTYDVMASADLLLTASGTATVEAVIFGTPMIVTYKLNPITVLALAPLLKVRRYAMVNILAGREIMPEYYQSKAKPELIAREAISILKNGRLESMRRELAEVRKKMGGPGASRRAAAEILKVAHG